MSKPQKHYLVTGGAGFIGSHIAKALLEQGDRVRIIDNLSTGSREKIPEGAEFIKADITNLQKITPYFKEIDGVFHTAAIPRVQTSIEQPLETNEANINGTLNVLLAARAEKVKRVIYSASSSAYGDQREMPLHEKMKPNPMSPYGLQKYVGEHYAKLASMFWDVETASLRYFNVYGPNMAFAGAYVTVIAVFLQQKARNEALTITGDGTQTRDFTYVDDVVLANLLAMESEKVGKGEVMNIGAGENHSVNEVAERIGGPAVNIAPRIEPHDTLANRSLAKKLLGWEPKIPFDEGLTHTIEWFANLQSNEQTKNYSRSRRASKLHEDRAAPRRSQSSAKV